MAVITKRIEVCDICRDVDAVVVTRVRMAVASGRLRTYALCEKDMAPVMDLMKRLGVGAPDAPPKRASRQVSMDQIEGVKEQRATSTTKTRKPR
jgi:hypothetical protein